MQDETASYKKIILIAILVGVISGIGALLLFEGLKIGTHFFMGTVMGYHMPLEGQSIAEIAQWSPPPAIWLIIPVITLGGLLSGLLVYSLAPEAEGDGTDAAIQAFHGEGKVRWRIPVLKAVTSILTIATGGSAGREGPASQISAGFGSIAADILGLTPRERRIALATGIGAGLGTIFKAPLGGAILAAEILYTRDFESEAIVPTFLASVIGYSIFCSFDGFEPVFNTADLIWSIAQIPFFLLLGVICAAVGLLYIHVFYGTQHLFTTFFERFHIPPHFKPCAGAFVIGVSVVVLAHISPDAFTLALASIGTGYGFLQLALYTMLPLSVLILLPFTKIITTSLTIGSGGSGGVFAPGLAIGGATGGAMGTCLHLIFPALVPIQSVPVFVIVGMIALFGGIANAPISVMIMVVEMTANFSLLIPAMGAVAISQVLTGERSIYVEQVRTKSESSAHRGEYIVIILEEIQAGDVMTKSENLITLTPEDPSEKVIALINETGHTGFPVLKDGKLAGILTIGDMRQVRADGRIHLPVGEVMRSDLVTVTPDQSLEVVLRLMIDARIHHMVVVDKDDPRKLLGFVTSTDLLKAYVHRLTTEYGYSG